MDKKKGATLAAAFSVAATWFSVHAGGGFASGSQTMGFLTRFGFHAIWTPVSMVVILALAYRELFIMGKNHNLNNFRALTNELYHPYEKVLSPIYEVLSIIASVMAIASCVAGGATVLESYLGVPYFAGIVVIGVGMLLLSIFGRDLVLKAGTALCIIIFVALVLICGVALTSGNGHLGTWMSSPEANSTSFGYVLLKMFSYVGFQCWGPVGALIGVTGVLKTNKDINLALVIGVFINAIMLWLTNVAMMASMPECTASALPLYWVCESTGQQAVLIAYVVALLAAYVSTGVGVVYGLAVRYTPLVTSRRPNANPTVINAIVGALFIIATVLVSTVGLTNIINYGLGYMGYVGIVVLFIPAITVAHIKNKKFAKEHPNFDEEQLSKSK